MGTCLSGWPDWGSVWPLQGRAISCTLLLLVLLFVLLRRSAAWLPSSAGQRALLTVIVVRAGSVVDGSSFQTSGQRRKLDDAAAQAHALYAGRCPQALEEEDDFGRALYRRRCWGRRRGRHRRRARRRHGEDRVGWEDARARWAIAAAAVAAAPAPAPAPAAPRAPTLRAPAGSSSGCHAVRASPRSSASPNHHLSIIKLLNTRDAHGDDEFTTCPDQRAIRYEVLASGNNGLKGCTHQDRGRGHLLDLLANTADSAAISQGSCSCRANCFSQK
jgi:hypothetical protein